MQCPYCRHPDTVVIDSRENGNGASIRRSCPKCGREFATVEGMPAKVQALPDIFTADLTPRQQRILDFVRETIEQRGHPPTVREISEAVGLVSPSSVIYQLNVLKRKGRLPPDFTET